MRRTSATKKRVGRFREYADALFEKREMVEVMSKLIGDILLDDELRRENKHDRDDEVRRGWEEVHWQRRHTTSRSWSGPCALRRGFSTGHGNGPTPRGGGLCGGLRALCCCWAKPVTLTPETRMHSYDSCVSTPPRTCDNYGDSRRTDSSAATTPVLDKQSR